MAGLRIGYISDGPVGHRQPSDAMTPTPACCWNLPGGGVLEAIDLSRYDALTVVLPARWAGKAASGSVVLGRHHPLRAEARRQQGLHHWSRNRDVRAGRRDRHRIVRARL